MILPPDAVLTPEPVISAIRAEYWEHIYDGTIQVKKTTFLYTEMLTPTKFSNQLQLLESFRKSWLFANYQTSARKFSMVT
jgi:hypothetical protein